MSDEPITFSVTATPYGPTESDPNPGFYLQRCAEALVTTYGYVCTYMVGPPDPNDQSAGVVRQLQVTIPDPDAPGGRRAVVVTAPEPIRDVGGDVMTQTAFNAKYGVS